MQTTIGFIGGGNMASAMIHGLLLGGQPAETLFVVDKHPEKLARFQALGVNTVDTPQALAEAVDIIILAIKPTGFDALIPAVQSVITTRHPIVVSIMSGILIERLEAAFPHESVMRVMPNTPCELGQGMFLMCNGQQVTQEQSATVQTVLNTMGQSIVLKNEDDFSALTGLTGCGPAFIYHWIETFAKSMQQITLDIDCLPLAIQTVKGALAMMQETGRTPDQLINQVSPKGGMTIEGMNILRAHEGELQALYRQTLQAAIDRGNELAKA